MDDWDLDSGEVGLNQDEIEDEPPGDDRLRNQLDSVEVTDQADELVLRWTGGHDGSVKTEMLRFARKSSLLRIFPKDSRSGHFSDQFDRITELQIQDFAWDPDNHSDFHDYYGVLQAAGLPNGFESTYMSGLGIKREYRDFVRQLEKHSRCTIIRFTDMEEGPDSEEKVFSVSLKRFEDYRLVVNRNRNRARTALSRVNEAECHNAVADLFDLDRIEPKYTKHPMIRALTEEVATGHVMDATDRAILADETTRVAPQMAGEAPERFAQLRTDIELASFEDLVDQFERALASKEKKESYWQGFFDSNRFALHQLFSMPIVVEMPQAHVQGTDLSGQGSRITDFLCANPITRSAVVVEIKTPATKLMAGKPYRGKGPSAIYAPLQELAGSVAQVQSHMAAIPWQTFSRPNSASQVNIDWNEVRGAVIVGMIDDLGHEQRESFLRYRAGLATVTVLGYDEVLARLRGLLDVLKSPPGPDHDAVTAGPECQARETP